MSGEKGFTYMAALLMIVVVATGLMVVQKQWSTIMKREREKQLLFRGTQIIQAIESFYVNSPGQIRQYPRSFDVLLKDNRFPTLKRHLRKKFKDPMTDDGSWGVIYDGKGAIKGVFTRHQGEPIKKRGFPETYKSFENKSRYSDWKFMFEPKKETTS